MKDELKIAIDKLQNHIVQSYESDNVLLIFDNQAELLKYKRAHKYMCPNQILITIEGLCYKQNVLDGLRYKRYHFIRNEEISQE